MSILTRFKDTNADGQPVFLNEVTYGEGGFEEVADGWSMVLAGKNLPNQGVVRSAELRYKKTYYAGREDASVQVLGRKQNPFVLEGHFYEEIALNPSLIGAGDHAARQQRNYLWALFYSTSIVRVSWGSNWDVLCLIKAIESIDHKHLHVGYKLTLDPVAPGQAHKIFMRSREFRREFQQAQALAVRAEDLRRQADEALAVVNLFRAGAEFLQNSRITNIGPGVLGEVLVNL